VILEYDFRRRGLRLDCVLLGKGIIAIIEFKRTALSAADRDQVTDYAINLVEFHEETRRACDFDECVIVPMLALTIGPAKAGSNTHEFHRSPWNSVVRVPLKCDRTTLHTVLIEALTLRRSRHSVDPARWLQSRFSPSSTIIDAAISLYGQHEVSSINAHAAPIEVINKCTEEVASNVLSAQRSMQNRIIFVFRSPRCRQDSCGSQTCLRSALSEGFRIRHGKCAAGRRPQ
jgi:hypothetical protein